MKRLRSCHKARQSGRRNPCEESRYGEERAEDRLDRHGPHGLSHGGAAAQGRLRRLHLEPHARQGRAARRQGRQGGRQARRSGRPSTWCSRSCRPARTSRRSISARTAWRAAARAGCRRSWSTARPSRSRNSAAIRERLQAARQRLRGLAGERQRQGDQGRQAVGGGLRPRGRLQGRDADDRGVRAARRLLCGRRRARARVQDRAQRDARRGDREPDRDHAAWPTRWACRATPSCRS